MPDSVAELYPQRTRASMDPRTSHRPLDAARDAQGVIDALVHQGLGRIPNEMAHDGGQRVSETGRLHAEEVRAVMQQTALEYARRATFGAPEDSAVNADLAQRIGRATVDYATAVRDYWAHRPADGR